MISFKYRLTYKQVKNINVSVDKYGNINVSAPKHVSVATIEAFLASIESKLLQMSNRKRLQNQIDIESKQTIYLLGKQYRFIKVKDSKYSYSISNDTVTLYYTNLQTCYDKMLKTISTNYFNELSYLVSAKMNLPYLAITAKKFTKSYGKNYNQSKIALNYKLIHLAPVYIKHVLYHEYCHCIWFNHSKAFYQLLSQYDSNYKTNFQYISLNLHRFC